MAESRTSPEQAGSHLTLNIWHPDCWTLQVTETAEGGLFGHGVYGVDDTVKGRFTAYADSEHDLDDLIRRIKSTPLTHSVWQMDHRYNTDRQIPSPGNESRSILVEYDAKNSINDALISNGFIPDEAVWIHDGREYWTVAIEQEREQIQDRLDEIREAMDAEIVIQQIVSDSHGHTGVLERSLLTERQRNVLEHARTRGYYSWPREINATELAEELDISKATLLEHLRKAEAKLFDVIL